MNNDVLADTMSVNLGVIEGIICGRRRPLNKEVVIFAGMFGTDEHLFSNLQALQDPKPEQGR